jgi:hypothetical protein
MITELLEYFRLTGYTIIILSSLNGIRTKKFNGLLFIGDIVMCTALLISSVGFKILGIEKAMSAPYVLTPAVFAWATIHFLVMLKRK